MYPAKGRWPDSICPRNAYSRSGWAADEEAKMNIRIGAFVIGTLAGLMALPASAQMNVDQSNCVRNDQIDNWKAFSDKLVMIESYTHRKVLLRLIGTCQNLTFDNRI